MPVSSKRSDITFQKTALNNAGKLYLEKHTRKRRFSFWSHTRQPLAHAISDTSTDHEEAKLIKNTFDSLEGHNKNTIIALAILSVLSTTTDMFKYILSGINNIEEYNIPHSSIQTLYSPPPSDRRNLIIQSVAKNQLDTLLTQQKKITKQTLIDAIKQKVKPSTSLEMTVSTHEKPRL